MKAAPLPASAARLIKVSPSGLLLPTDASDWVAVYQPDRQLTWTRVVVAGGRRPWKQSVKAASEVDLCGWTGWRAASRLDYAHLIEDQLYGPAIDPAFFTVADPYQWEWTGTECAPAGGAWGVYLDDGAASRYSQSSPSRVRAVRSGQLSWPLGQEAA